MLFSPKTLDRKMRLAQERQRQQLQLAANPTTCPVRYRCHKYEGYRCGFEQVGTVAACPKRKRMEER